MSSMINIRVNGLPEEVDENSSIRTILNTKGINPNIVACELNLTVIRRGKLGETILKDGDVLEIIHMMGGGSHGVSNIKKRF